MARAAVIRDAANPAGIGQFAVIQSAAPSFGMELNPIVARDSGDIERAVTTFARSPNGGLIVLARLEIPPMLLARADEVIE